MHKWKKWLIAVFILVIVAVTVAVMAPELSKKYSYKVKYSEYVDKYAQANNIDKYLVYAFMRTESSFNEKATSNVGARGLMQIMPDTYDWVKMRIKDKREISFDDMYNPEYNIEYCTYLIGYLMKKYDNNLTLSIAAYHAGFNQVDRWLADSSISKDGKTIEIIPSKSTAHYVKKVESAYHSYKNLYEK